MLKNYTSSVPAARSIMHIENRLVEQGAKNIMKWYDSERQLKGMCFIVSVNGADMSFRIPAKVDQVEIKFKAAVRRPKEGTYGRIKAQAERTAWKLLSDWVDVQMSLIELGQVEVAEVFLPYVYDHAKDKTFYESIKDNGFKRLPHIVSESS